MSWQERCHVKEIDLGLERVAKVYKRLNAQDANATYTITVAGTNGKGSSVALLESILIAQGYSVGVYSTPHLIKYNERIKLNGEPVTDELITSSFAHIDSFRESVSLSYFEFGTLAALDIFSDHQVDIQILEVGLGGRLDAVNIIDANAVLITSIDVDHVDWLGDDVSKIALEKAGVFRANQKAVCADKTVPVSLLNYAQALRTDLKVAGADFRSEKNGNSWALIADNQFAGQYPLPALRGEHQVQNAAGVISLLAHIFESIPVKKESIEEGLKSVFLEGRLQLISTEPDVYLDVAHNNESALALAKFLQSVSCSGKVHAVFSILADKDIGAVVEPMINMVDHWYVAPLNSNRAQATEYIDDYLTKEARQACSKYGSIQAALTQAKSIADKQDLVICFGSFYVVEACLEAL